MTSLTNSAPLAAHRITPSARNLRTLRLDDSLIALKRWQLRGAEAEPPAVFGATWTGDPGAPPGGVRLRLSGGADVQPVSRRQAG